MRRCLPSKQLTYRCKQALPDMPTFAMPWTTASITPAGVGPIVDFLRTHPKGFTSFEAAGRRIAAYRERPLETFLTVY